MFPMPLLTVDWTASAIQARADGLVQPTLPSKAWDSPERETQPLVWQPAEQQGALP
jgi:hypothetical protein